MEHLDMVGDMRRERKMTILPFAQCHIEQVSGLLLYCLIIAGERWKERLFGGDLCLPGS